MRCRCCSSEGAREGDEPTARPRPAGARRTTRASHPVDHHGYQVRHRRSAERRQVDSLQRADARADRGGELSVLHDRSERRRRAGARSAAASARGDRAARRRSCRRRSSSSTSRAWSPAHRRAKASATSSSRTSARSMRSRTSCAASRTTTSCTSPARSIRSSDIDVIDTELALADLDTRRAGRCERAAKAAKGGDKDAIAQRDAARALRKHSSMPASRRARCSSTTEERRVVRELHLLTRSRSCTSPTSPRTASRTTRISTRCAQRAAEERRRGRAGLRGDRSGDRAARRSRSRGVPGRARPRGARAEPRDPRRLQAARPADLLHGRPKEVRAWTVRAGATAPQAAGVIHTDFERGFIRAEVIAYDDYIAGGRGGREGSRQAAPRRQGIHRPRRRRDALPLQRVSSINHSSGQQR